MDMPGTNVRLEPPRMATNKSRGGPWGWDVTPRGKRGCVNAASRVRLLYEGSRTPYLWCALSALRTAALVKTKRFTC